MDIECVVVRGAELQKWNLTLPPGSTIAEALKQAGISLTTGEAVGLFSELKSEDTVLQEGDRLEIYRPLLHDPKLKRQARVGQKNLPRRCSSGLYHN